MNNERRWPEPHDDALKRHVAVGLTFAQISARLLVDFRAVYSRNACIGRARRLGITRADKPKPKKGKPEPIVHVRRPQAAPERAPPVQRAAVQTLDLTIYQLTDQTCRWPHGERAPYTYCGCPVWEGGPYCAEHTGLARSPGTRGEQMAARGLARIS